MTEDVVTIKDLLEAGVHFGHQTNRWNPRMKPFIFTSRNKIYIIDLQQTQKQLTEVYNFVRDAASRGQTILFVGTKKQAHEVVKEEAIRCGMPYIVTRWLGGTLTNFETIKKSIDKLHDIEQKQESGETGYLTKKEQAKLTKEKQRLLRNLEGIKDMKKVPDIVFVVDTLRERTAVAESAKLHIPIIGLIDSNSNPTRIDYCVVGNDDAIKSIQVVTSVIANAVLEGNKVAPIAPIETAQT